MKRALLALVLMAATVVAPCSSGEELRTTSVRLGGNVLQLVSGQGSLWVLTWIGAAPARASGASGASSA